MPSWILLIVSAGAIAGLVASLITFGIAPGWRTLAAHLALAFGILPLILAAMIYFTPVLTRTRAAAGAVPALPLTALAAGAVAVSGFAVPAGSAWAHPGAALLAIGAIVALAGWMWRRRTLALGGAHPGLDWYLAALGCLLVALATVVAMPFLPEQVLPLRRLHLHLNLFGFVALTAVGTLQVLFPTVAGEPDLRAGARLRRDLRLALPAALLLALGAAWWPALAWAGGALWLVVLGRLAVAWLGQFRRALFAWHRATVALGAALAGLLLMLLAGAGHAGGWWPATRAVPAFLTAFLLPLVTGALSHLLPLWWRPTAHAWQAAARARLARASGLRALLFLIAGLVVLVEGRAGIALALAGLVWFGGVLAHALRRAP